MRVLVCGDRNWTDKATVALALSLLPNVQVVIEGGCRGADRLAAEVAGELGIKVEEYPAQWDRYGRAAGPIRNQQMLEQGKPDIVLAFHDDLSKSKGTADMVRRAEKAGKPVHVWCSGSWRTGGQDA